MSSTSKACIVGASTFSIFMMYFVHSNQFEEKQRMSAGVERDEERKRVKQSRFDELNRQRELNKFYEKDQPITKSSDNSS
ncbi:Pet117 cytochrome c oxidase assembly protein [Schizosaccharomyces cryophilus OY26]|uniref:Pet117 cytochrome c oxidase assembly protein n=1 Tax=Schizosaccharomyces cryophilus (strain OY26 / ATCC MYA-4695 / CBS 11777 / NBRC 106824 / NRRL Y48691) TaxID=653667 RepID=S9W506_SCHCR|nr:Pet117 cytochrome c oxidase assembly protein [Schizosaccharomyces cryophilus OY26]EPY53619.1 Pet117 cytochrome c oxidase assembly protein [Schizosaccharomyces cryophilus OY26]